MQHAPARVSNPDSSQRRTEGPAGEPIIYPTDVPWNGEVIGLDIHNSTYKQVGNWRSLAQSEDMSAIVLSRGFPVLLADEQGTSGADLTKRKVTLRLLKYLARGEIHGLAAYEVSRLTRDEFGVDGGTIAKSLVETTGRFITRGHTPVSVLSGGAGLAAHPECLLVRHFQARPKGGFRETGAGRIQDGSASDGRGQGAHAASSSQR